MKAPSAITRAHPAYVYFAAFAALGLVPAALGPTLTALAAKTGTPLGDIGILFTARSLGYLPGALLAGALLDRFPGHPLMASALLLTVASLFLVPVTSHLWVLAALLLFAGFIGSVIDVGGNTLIVWVYREEVGPFMNFLHFSYALGAFISPLIVAQALIWTGGIRWAYWILGLLMLPVAFVLFRAPSPPLQSTSARKASPPPRWSIVGLILLFYLLYAGTEISFGGWIYTYAVNLNLASETEAAYLTSGFWGAFMVGRLLAVPFAVRFDPRTLLFATLTGGLLLTFGLYLSAASPLWTTLCTIGLGLSMASIFPSMLSFAQRHIAISGKVTGFFFVGASIGGMTLPWIIGRRFETTGPETLPLTLLITLSAALLILITLLFLGGRRLPVRG